MGSREQWDGIFKGLKERKKGYPAKTLYPTELFFKHGGQINAFRGKGVEN